MTAQATRGQDPAVTPARLSLILPAYNEEAVLGSVLSEIVRGFPEAEIILVSDGSSDGTASVAAAFRPAIRVIDYQPNRGKGYAIRQGMLAGSGEVLVFSDSDLPFGVEGIGKVIAALGSHPEADIAIAEKTSIPRGFAYRAARSLAKLGIKALTGLGYPDTQAGLKAFRRAAAREVYSRTRIDGFASDVEVLFIAKQRGFHVVSVPLSVTAGYARPSRFNYRQGLRLLRDVGRIRLGR